MAVQRPNPQEIRDIIAASKEPLVFQNVLNWDILNWSLEDWNKEIGKEELQMRLGKNMCTLEPQWESTTQTIKCTFEKFLNGCISDDEWLYFDYKYLSENLFSCKNLQEGIRWDPFGFPNLTYKDSTIWIGTKGAHTPCHVDTYGCNLIAQVYGRKEWFVCPPEESVYPTRIPYEESSVFSKINFFSPNIQQIQNISNARQVTLNPGEVLFLPHGWWHYVENLETAISINVWIPQPEDDEKRVEEGIARLIVNQIVKELPQNQRSKILNPNMEKECIHKESLTQTLAVLQECIKATTGGKKLKMICTEVQKENDIKSEFKNNTLPQYVKTLHRLSRDDVCKWAEKQNARFNNAPIPSSEDCQDLAARVIDALLQPEVLNLVKNKLI